METGQATALPLDRQIQNKEQLRIAIYSQDGFGLGHMRRTTSIAWQVYQMRANASILSLSNSQLGQFFQVSPNHDYLKLPSIYKAGPGDWKASHLNISTDEILGLRKQLIRSAILHFAPHIFLVDHMPHGAMGELIPALEALKDNGISTKVVLGLRDILDAPYVTRHVWQTEGAYDAIRRFYSRVLVYGMKEVFDVAEKYDFPGDVTDMVRYCGYVCHLDNARNVSKIRAKYLVGTPAGTRLIVAMAGGGADAYPLMSALLDAFPKVQTAQRCVLALITGPFMPDHLVADLNRRAKSLPVRVIESVDDTFSYISAADLIVSMAGYNTCVEILRIKKPAILVPRSGPSAEQRTRSKLFAARNWVETIDPDELTPNLLAQMIVFQFRRASTIQMVDHPDLYGATVAANQILALQESEQNPELVKVE